MAVRDPSPTVRAWGGLATRAQLLDAAFAPSDVATALRRGRLIQVRRAHFAVPDAPSTAVEAVRIGGRLGGPSAASSFGLWSGHDPRLHVVVPANASRLRPAPLGRAVTLHWLDTPVHQECWRVDLATCLRQMIAWCDRETALACLDTAVTRFGVMGARAGDGPRTRLLLAAARPGSDSGNESIVRRRLEAAGVTVRQQARIAGVGRVDMIVPGTPLVIEVDGRGYHSAVEQFENDRRRDAALIALGRIPLRLSAQRIHGDWSGCVGDVLGAIAQFRSR
jgi:very-short-patch-repair endonuclease